MTTLYSITGGYRKMLVVAVFVGLSASDSAALTVAVMG